MAYPKHIRPIERPIIDRIINKALERKLKISVFNGEAWALRASEDYEAITAEIHATDLTQLRFRNDEGAVAGSVIFIHGNDEDVVHDYTANPLMEALCAA